MNGGYKGLYLILFLLLLIISYNVYAQPTLPDIAYSYDNRIVTLTWNCQYNGIKSIVVRRSSDSVSDYSDIGNVVNVKKGIQIFKDHKPLDGKNYYKLLILFNSGLKWSSNTICIKTNEENVEKKVDKNNAKKNNSNEIDINKLAAVLEAKMDSIKPTPVNTEKKIIPLKESEVIQHFIVSKDTLPKQSIHLCPSGKRLKFYYKDDTANSPEVFIKSTHIFTDTTTGHIRLDLTDDINLHIYSLRIYDKNEHLLINVPHIKESKIIIDKRNFQKKGVYNFILKKDIWEYDRGNFLLK